MCYTGRCLWEGYMGDCTFPSYIGRNFGCHCTTQEFIDVKNELTKYKNNQKRKYKIKVIKNKLLNKSF